MKDFLPVVKLTLIGLIVTVLVFPLVHESGHIIAAVLCGGRVIRLTLLPLPSVMCELDGTVRAVALCSLAGAALPTAVAYTFIKSKGILRCAGVVFAGASVLSAVIDFSLAVLRLCGVSVDNTDITLFMDFSAMTAPALFIAAVMLCLSVLALVLLKPCKTVAELIFVQAKSSVS